MQNGVEKTRMDPNGMRDDIAARFTPDHSDFQLKVVSPHSWLALIVLLVISALVVVWSFVGVIPSYVDGPGIVLRQSGSVVNMLAPAEGRLISYEKGIGEIVDEGDLLVVIDRVDVRQELTQLRNQRDYLLSQWRTAKERFYRIYIRAQETHTFRRNVIQAQLQEEQLALDLLEQIFEQRNQGAAGLKLEELSDIRTRMREVRASITELQSNLSQMDLSLIERQQSLQSEIDSLDQQIVGVETSIRQKQFEIHTTSEIRATGHGRVVGYAANQGSIITAGQDIVNIATGEDALEVLLYVPARQGKQVETGQEVQFSPSTAQPEEFGYMVGRVTSVSLVPLNEAEMMKDLGNKTLVDSFSENGAPISVRVALMPNTETKSGYQWSSIRGHDVVLSDGTLGDALIKTDEQRPISILIPTLNHYLGL